jgi:hypothetical protein
MDRLLTLFDLTLGRTWICAEMQGLLLAIETLILETTTRRGSLLVGEKVPWVGQNVVAAARALRRVGFDQGKEKQ